MATLKRTKRAAAAAAAATPTQTDTISFPSALAAARKPTNTREQILHAAVEVLYADGFGALTQSHVAACAGVRQSHITYYFPSRNELLREAAAYGCNALLEALAGGIESGTLNLANFRAVMTVDIHDRRFARLICALIVASDEDPHIKLWLASFEEANLARLQQNFHQLGLPVTTDEVTFFHSTYVGAVMLDLGESSADSLARAQRSVTKAFDVVFVAARARAAAQKSRASLRKVKK